MKTALVTKDRYVFVPSSADVLLKDEDYLKVMTDVNFRHKFLHTLGVDKIYVQRLGSRKSKYFILKDSKAPEFKDDRYRSEVGVIARV